MKKLGYVYMITSPTGRIYIGSTKNIQNRIKSYRTLNCKNQVKLYNSLLKYGWENHIFEVIMECLIEEVLRYECILGNYFNVPVIAFNPAIHSRSFEPTFRKLIEQDPYFNFASVIVLGLKDSVIDPKKTVEILEDAEFDIQYELYPEMKHRIPFDVFVNIYNKYVK
jgi:hypothetical protein